MGIKSVGLNLGQVDQVGWGGAGWASVGPSWAANWAEHGKSKGKLDWAGSK
jgi:hypothetical protein